MKTRYLIVIMVAGVIIIVMSAYHFWAKPAAGEAAPLFTVKDVHGADVSLSNERGKIVFLHFWAAWCGTCITEIPTIERLHEEFKGRDLAILAVLIEDNQGFLSGLMRGTRISYRVLLDPDGMVADMYKVWGVPETFIIDKDGVILGRFSTAVAYEDMKSRLEKLLAN